MKKPLILIIMDGFGLRDDKSGNAIAAASGCDSAQRRIRLDLRVKDGFFVFACEIPAARQSMRTARMGAAWGGKS